ncbi:MAG: response regulator transcription factor [Bacteroidales bacterium]|nr:response regulator transcription factor [Bacteroidales bacterium]
MEKIKIILADDHRIFRDGIISLLSDNESINIIGVASCGSELLSLLKTHKPEVVILDITMPGLSGIELTKDISVRYPEISIMILSMHTAEEFVINAVKAGARAYLPKDTTKEELMEAIKVLSEGGEYYSKSVSDNFLKSFIKKQKVDQNLKDNDELTQREIEILKLAAGGMGNKDIADKLFISVKTVDAHKNHIMVKLKLKNTAEMVLYAVKNKIIEI